MVATIDRESWLAERRTGLGASDAAAVCGLSQWRQPLSVYLSKVQGDREPMSEEQYWGLVHENVLALEYSKRTGVPLEEGPPMWRHPLHPWLFANVDRVPPRRDLIVELKTSATSQGWGEPGTDEVPREYLIQGQHQMLVTEIDRVDFAVLFGGNRFAIYTVRANADLQRDLMEVEASFWWHVEKRHPPAPDWEHPSTPALVERLCRPDGKTVVAADKDDEQLVRRWVEAKAEAARFETIARELKAKIAHRMGDSAVLALSDGSQVTRKVVERSGYTVEPTSYVDTRFKKGGDR